MVSRGTLPDQATGAAPLAEIAERAAGLPGPALVVIGDVVTLVEILGPAPAAVHA